MISNADKNIILIKDIPSNIIEEAIFILKEDTSDKMNEIKIELAKSESEIILQNYIDEEMVYSSREKKSIKRKNKKLKNIFAIAVCIFLSLVVSILNRT